MKMIVFIYTIEALRPPQDYIYGIRNNKKYQTYINNTQFISVK